MDKQQTNNPTKKSKQTNKTKKLAKNGVTSYEGQSYFKLESHEL